MSLCISLLLATTCSLAAQSVSEPPPCSQLSKSYSEGQCLNDLANDYHSAAKYSDEILVLRRLVSVREKETGSSKQIDLAQALRRLGYALIYAQSYSEAESTLNRALSIQQQALGQDDRETAETLHLLGEAYVLDGRYPDAEKSFSRSLEIRQEAFPPSSPGYPNVAESFEDLGALYETEGNLGKAEVNLKSAVQVLDEHNKPGSDVLLITRDLDSLSKLYTREARYEDAERLFKRALNAIDNQPGVEALALPVLRDYADLLDLTNRQAEAQAMRDRAEAIVSAERRRIPAPVIVHP
jgi:tetratricopeptide (TPR) repeat protein